MTSARWTRGAVVAASLMAAGFATVAGPAAADPMSEALANTSCSYAQVTAAMNAEAPALAAQLSLRPDVQTNLQTFLALPVDQRRQRIAQEQAANPAVQELLAATIGPQAARIASTCMNY